MTATLVASSPNAKAKKKAKRLEVHPSPYTVRAALAKGDIFTRLTVLVMGLGNIVRGQVVKGAIFLVAEGVFIYLFLTSGIQSIFGDGTVDHPGLGWLGPVLKSQQTWVDGKLQFVNATNSVTVLLYGIAWIFIVLAFVVVWVTSLRSAYKAQVLHQTGQNVPSFAQDVRDLLDNRIHSSLMALPTLGLLVFTILPLVFMISMAFTSFDNNNVQAFNWVGLDTFATVFSPTGSADLGVNAGLFLRVLIWTLVWAFLATFLNFFLGMFITMVILRNGTRLKSLWRICFSMSIAVPQFVSLLVIHQMLQPTGIVNQMLTGWGLIDSPLPFFTDEWWARATVIIVNLWIGIPFTIMQITGILQNVPAELYEASKIDGANWVQTFVHITMPYIFFVMTPYLITTFVGNVNNFNVIFFLSGGAPSTVEDSAGKTDLLITWLYKLTVERLNYNVGAVIGILTFIVLAVVSLLTYRSSGSYKNEEGFR